MNNKAIMVKFLTTLILALIIFIPACLFVSNLFTLSDQGLGSFEEFTDKLGKFSNSDELKKTVLLIQDKEAGIVFFSRAEEVYTFNKTYPLNVAKDSPDTVHTTKRYHLSYEDTSCTGIPCACLCRSFNEEKSNLIGSAERKREVVQYSEVTTDTELRTVGCDLLKCVDLPDVQLKESWSTYRHQEDARRITVNLFKEGDEIVIK